MRTPPAVCARSPRLAAPVFFAALTLVLAMLACSLNDVIGQRPAAPTPTVAVFSTATPGGRLSVSLLTPTGDAPRNPPSAPDQAPGQVIGPAATATVLFATVQAATAAALITPVLPAFLPGDSPAIAAPPPPVQPTAFNQYRETIGRYLSAGGPPQLLEAALRDWGAVTEGAVVQADTDLTGDGAPEIVVTLYDPALVQVGQPSPGELLVYGCAQGGYRLLFTTQFGPGTVIPELRRVGDMNGDIRAELAYTQLLCESGRCSQTMQILAWNVLLGAFGPVNEAPIAATNGRIAIADLENDGVLEVAVTFSPTGDISAGPPRRRTEIWDWDGQVYRLAVIELEPPVYRIHALHDADVLFSQGQWEAAIREYERVRDNSTLQPWPLLPNELVVLRAYAGYRRVLALVANGSLRTATNAREALVAENPPGTPGEVYAALTQAFSDAFRRGGSSITQGCQAVLTLIQTRPDALYSLNSYGTGNRLYTAEDLCPFQ